MLRVMGGLTLVAAVDHSLAPTALLKLDAALRPVQLMVITGGVATSYKATAKVAAHALIHRQHLRRDAHTLT